MSSKSVTTSLVFKFIERVAVKAVGFLIGILLARLLDPDIFGIVAIFSAVVALAQTFVESGMGTALIQNKNTQREDYSTIFYISMGIALLLYGLLYLLAPVITAYYEIPEYVTHFRVLCLTLPFYAFNSIQAAKLSRQMQFHKMLLCQLVASLLSGILGVVLAYAGFGIWALILHHLASAVLICITYCFVAKWHPEWVFSLTRARELVGFGLKMLASGLLCSLFYNLRTFVIGKLYTKTELALYSRGDQIPSLISKAVDDSFKAVMLPTYAKKQDQPREICRLLGKTIRLNSYLNSAAMLGLAAVAQTAVTVIYGAKWESCVPYVQLLSVANLTIPITASGLVAIKAIGRSDVYLRLETVRRVIMLAVLLLSLAFGSLEMIALGWVVSCVVDVFVILVPVKKLLGYSLGQLARDTLPSLAMAAVMAAVVLLLQRLPLLSLPLLLVQMAGGAASYWLLSVLFRVSSYRELKNKVFSMLKKQK